MPPRKANSSKPAKPSRKIQGLIIAAGICTTAGAGVVFMSLLHNHGRPAGAAGLCESFDIDQNTGNVRDKGLIPCNQVSLQNSRFDLIRDSFRGH